MPAPNDWPFSSWLEVEDSLENISDDATRGILQLQAECLASYRELLTGSSVFERPPVFRKVTPGFTATWWMGARAYRLNTENEYAISIDGGTWVQLHLAFTRLLAHPQVLTDQRRKDLPPLRRRLGLPRLASQDPALRDSVHALFSDDLTAPESSDDPLTATCHRHLLWNAMHFVFFHELMHVLHNHIPFRSLLVATEPDPERVNTTARGLEHLADIYGSHWAIVYALLSADLSKKDRSSALRNLGFAIGTVFLLQECLTTPKENSSHPPATLRRLMVAAAAQVAPVLDEERATLSRVLEGIQEAERSWRLLGWTHQRPDNVDINGLVDDLAKVDRTLQAVAQSGAWPSCHSDPRD